METVEDIKTATNLKYGAKSVVVESINLKMILYTEAKKRLRKTQSKHGTGGRRMTEKEIVQILEAILERNKADGCVGCAFWNKESWDMPCKECKRNCKDYWRAKDDTTRN